MVSGSAFGAAFTGFQTNMSVASVKDVTIAASSANMNAATGIVSMNLSVVTNYSGWALGAFGPGLVNTTQGNHTLPLTFAQVAGGAAAPAAGAYGALVDSPNVSTLTASGAYSATAQSYDLYLKCSSLSTARAGYYGAYVNLKFTDSI